MYLLSWDRVLYQKNNSTTVLTQVTKSTSAPAVEGETEATEATESTESTDPTEAGQEVLEIKQESKSNEEAGSQRADRRVSTNLLARRSG